MTRAITLVFIFSLLIDWASPAPAQSKAAEVLAADASRPFIERFNRDDDEKITTAISNAACSDWMIRNVPRFECPEKQIEEIYYFRWWTYRKHIKQTPEGYVIDEFLPNVGWAKKYNTISCAAGHHIYEGRWVKNPRYIDDYETFWFRRGGDPKLYSFWAADAVYARYLVDGNKALAIDLLPDLVKNYQCWEQTHYTPAVGLFHQIDDRDGMEISIGGSGYRPTINSYMYGDAVAIAKIADLAGKPDIAGAYRAKAAALKKAVQDKLWDAQAQFFKVSADGSALADVRELIGYVPWYFHLPDAGREIAWKQLMDEQGFFAPYGPTTAERRHPRFMFAHKHDCLWNGPSWPYATAQTLTAMANVLNDYHQDAISKPDYLTVLSNYAKSQHRDGKPWVAEDLDGITGKWIVDKPRSLHYNHSSYCDLVITGLVGLRPRSDEIVEVNPLVPDGVWDYFCLDGVSYHGRSLTIFFDRTGARYHRGVGLHVLADGKEMAAGQRLQRLMGTLPPPAPVPAPAASDESKPVSVSSPGAALPPPPGPATAPVPGSATAVLQSNWVKDEHSPVLGGKLGTCFDITVLKEQQTYRMWFSWRPKKSIALTESADGVHWSPPQIALGPSSSGWEDEVNRPAVVKRDGGYHMWYTGQARGHSSIGHATSLDGITWTRDGAAPVILPDQAWEKVAVMCPDVMWDAPAKEYRMWYSGGEQFEPDAIGYAVSPDGKTWIKLPQNPIFSADPKNPWEQHKVTACQVVKHGEMFYMFYIGFSDVHHAQIGIARSPDGISQWQRLATNPILSPTPGAWDADAVYKPSVLFDGTRWMLWYNGRRKNVEQIGLATHEGESLGFAK